jgi:hypothetical protein
VLTLASFKARSVMPAEDIDALVRLRWRRELADVASGDILGETLVGEIVESGTASAVLLRPLAALVADDSAFATVNVYKRTAGGARSLVATLTTKTISGGGAGSWARDVHLALVIASATVLAGDEVTAEITKSGAGVIVPAFDLSVQSTPNFVERRLDTAASWILARLRKRYNTKQIIDATPEIVLGWQEALVTLACFKRRGFNPSSAQDAEIVKAAEDAKLEIKEAADSNEGLFDLPILDSPDASAISKSSTFGYSEASAYAWTDVQRERVADEEGWR